MTSATNTKSDQQFQGTKARYTLATELNSTRSTSLKVDRVAFAPYTLTTSSTISAKKLTVLATKSTELTTMSTVTSCRD